MDPSAELCQFIIVRRDLKMPKGKLMVQGGHACSGILRSKLLDGKALTPQERTYFESPEHKKICKCVDGEKELMEAFAAAETAMMPLYLVTDLGLTCFEGVPTKTCFAAGPWYRTHLDDLFGHLPLY